MRLFICFGVVIALLWGSVAAGAEGFDEGLRAARKLHGEKKHEEAVAACRALIEEYPGEPTLYRAYVTLGIALLYLRRHQEAIDVYKKVLESDDGGFRVQGALGEAWFNMGKCYEALQQYDEAQEAFMKTALCYPWVEWYSRRAVRCVKFMNTNNNRYVHSLVPAKLYFYSCPPDEETLKEAAEFVVKALQAVDGDSERAETFLMYQRFGPAGPDGVAGTDDDSRNVLLEISLPSDEEREAALKVQRAYLHQWELPVHYQCRRRGYVALFTDHPRVALQEFYNEYKRCPPERIKVAVEDVLGALRAVAGRPWLVKEFTDYQEYGANGPDGKPGTDDDLTDPVAAVLQRE